MGCLYEFKGIWEHKALKRFGGFGNRRTFGFKVLTVKDTGDINNLKTWNLGIIELKKHGTLGRVNVESVALET